MYDPSSVRPPGGYLPTISQNATNPLPDNHYDVLTPNRGFNRFKIGLQGASVAPSSNSIYFCTHDVIMMQKMSLVCTIYKMIGYSCSS